ncbi:transferrin-binding protein-like solute binding protein [Actinobacillus porcinus]|uniref:transferrin-binding protein-like solute binding protein n=1 Tax=Actinobacillus porcinus TaxID=51048 RepID=UPI0023525972|nr:transferrin-binding protein-like solute binding protein [Actinobacillus porcinus]
MNKIAKFGFTLLTASLLAACGSSGGGSSSPATSDKPTTPSTSENPSTPTQENPSNSANSSGSSNQILMGTAASNNEDYDLGLRSDYKTVLVVDGKTLPIAYPGIQSGGFTVLNAATINGQKVNGFAVSGTKFNNVKFGYVDGYVFHQGNPTAETNMPTTGKATYSVDGVYVKNGVATTSQGANLTADFGNKTLSGTVFAAKDGIADVKTEFTGIEGNEFYGSVKQDGAGGATLKGQFYGLDASEIGGVFFSSDYSGAFGGEKQ